MDKSETYLKSIDNTLKDILKELKRQARLKEMTSFTIHANEGDAQKTIEAINHEIERTRFTTGRK